MVPWVFLADPGSDGGKNTHHPANLRRKGVFRRMQAVVPRVRRRMRRVDGRRRWSGAKIHGNDPMRGGNGGVIRGNGGRKDEDGGLG